MMKKLTLFLSFLVLLQNNGLPYPLNFPAPPERPRGTTDFNRKSKTKPIGILKDELQAQVDEIAQSRKADIMKAFSFIEKKLSAPIDIKTKGTVVEVIISNNDLKNLGQFRSELGDSLDPKSEAILDFIWDQSPLVELKQGEKSTVKLDFAKISDDEGKIKTKRAVNSSIVGALNGAELKADKIFVSDFSDNVTVYFNNPPKQSEKELTQIISNGLRKDGHQRDIDVSISFRDLEKSVTQVLSDNKVEIDDVAPVMYIDSSKTLMIFVPDVSKVDQPKVTQIIKQHLAKVDKLPENLVVEFKTDDKGGLGFDFNRGFTRTEIQFQPQVAPPLVILAPQRNQNLGPPPVLTAIPRVHSTLPVAEQAPIKQFIIGPLKNLADSIKTGKGLNESSKAVGAGGEKVFRNRDFRLSFHQLSNMINPGNIRIFGDFKTLETQVLRIQNGVNTALHPKGFRIIANLVGSEDDKKTWKIEFTVFEVKSKRVENVSFYEKPISAFGLDVVEGFEDLSNVHGQYVLGSDYVFFNRTMIDFTSNWVEKSLLGDKPTSPIALHVFMGESRDLTPIPGLTKPQLAIGSRIDSLLRQDANQNDLKPGDFKKAFTNFIVAYEAGRAGFLKSGKDVLVPQRNYAIYSTAIAFLEALGREPNQGHKDITKIAFVINIFNLSQTPIADPNLAGAALTIMLLEVQWIAKGKQILVADPTTGKIGIQASHRVLQTFDSKELRELARATLVDFLNRIQ